MILIKLKMPLQKIIINVLVLMMALLNTQCSPANEPAATVNSKFIGDVIIHDKLSPQSRLGPEWEPEAPQGIGLGFVRPGERDMPPDNRSQNDEFYLAEKKEFGTLLILSAPKPTLVLVTALLDYQQISFELDGQIGLLHQVTIPPGGDLEIPIKIRVDTAAGIHDLMVVAFADPYNNSVDPLFRSSLDVDLVGRRAQLISGGVKNIPPLPQAIRGEKVPGNVILGFGAAFVTNPGPGDKSHPADRQLYVAQGKTRDIFKFQVWSSNLKGEKGSDYALVLFKNYHQIPLKDQMLTIINLQPNEESIMDAQVELSGAPSVDQLQIVYVFDPYKSLLNDEVRAHFVFNSARLAINVLDK